MAEEAAPSQNLSTRVRAFAQWYLLVSAALIVPRLALSLLVGSETFILGVGITLINHVLETVVLPAASVHRLARVLVFGYSRLVSCANWLGFTATAAHVLGAICVPVLCAFTLANLFKVAKVSSTWWEKHSPNFTSVAHAKSAFLNLNGSRRALMVGVCSAAASLLLPLMVAHTHGFVALLCGGVAIVAILFMPDLLGFALTRILTDAVLKGYPMSFGRIVPIFYLTRGGRLQLLVDVQNFSFGNPPGFPNPHFVSARHVQVAMSCNARRLATFVYHLARHGWSKVDTLSPELDSDIFTDTDELLEQQELKLEGELDEETEQNLQQLSEEPDAVAKVTKIQAMFRGLSGRKESKKLRAELEDGEEERAYAVHKGGDREKGPITPSEQAVRRNRRKLTIKVERIEVNHAAVNFETHKGELNVCTLSRMLGESEMRRRGCLPKSGPLPNQLMVRIARASGVRAADANGLSDPFVTARVRDMVSSTQVCSATRNPVWDRTITFPVDDVSAVLELRVLDKDVMTTDDVIGTWVMPLKRLCINHRDAHAKGWFPLQNKKGLDDGKSGHIFLEVHWRHMVAKDKSWKNAVPKRARQQTPLDQLTHNSRETSLRIGNSIIARRWLKLYPIQFDWELFILRHAHVYITDLFRGRKGSTGVTREDVLKDSDSEESDSQLTRKATRKERRLQAEVVRVGRLELNNHNQLRPPEGTNALTLWDVLLKFALGVAPKVISVQSVASVQLSLFHGFFGARSETRDDEGSKCGDKSEKGIMQFYMRRAGSIIGDIGDKLAVSKAALHRLNETFKRGSKSVSETTEKEEILASETMETYDDDEHRSYGLSGLLDLRKPRGTCAWRLRFAELKDGKMRYSGVSSKRSATLVHGTVPYQLWTRSVNLEECTRCEFDRNTGILTLTMGGKKPGPILLRATVSKRVTSQSEDNAPDLSEWHAAIHAFLAGEDGEDEKPVTMPQPSDSLSIAEELRRKMLEDYESSDGGTDADGKTETSFGGSAPGTPVPGSPRRP